MKRFSFILMSSAFAVLLAVDVTYFCSNSAVLSQVNASSSSGAGSSASYSSSASTSDPNIGTIIKYIWRAANYYAVYYTVKDGIEKETHKEKKGYSAWVANTYIKSKTEYADGKIVIIYGKKRDCTKFDGDQEGNCSPVGTSEFLD